MQLTERVGEALSKRPKHTMGCSASEEKKGKLSLCTDMFISIFHTKVNIQINLLLEC
jgi:hypothetical protein